MSKAISAGPICMDPSASFPAIQKRDQNDATENAVACSDGTKMQYSFFERICNKVADACLFGNMCLQGLSENSLTKNTNSSVDRSTSSICATGKTAVYKGGAKCGQIMLGMTAVYHLTPYAQSAANQLPPNTLDKLASPLAYVPLIPARLALDIAYQITDRVFKCQKIGDYCSDSSWRQDVLSSPIAEEIVFRWGLQDKIVKPVTEWALKKYGPEIAPKLRSQIAAIVSIIGVSTVFATIHHSIGEVGISQLWAERFVRSCLYGAVEEVFGVAPAITTHLFHNHITKARFCHYT